MEVRVGKNLEIKKMIKGQQLKTIDYSRMLVNVG
jgi:hypothetical protein